MLKLICATKCSNIHMHPQIHSQDSLHFTLTLDVLRGAALPHLKGGTAALEPWHYRDLSDRWGLGVFIPFLFLPNGYLLPPAYSSTPKTEKEPPLSLPPLVTLSPQANPLISPSIIERKGSKTRLKSSSIEKEITSEKILYPVHQLHLHCHLYSCHL